MDNKNNTNWAPAENWLSFSLITILILWIAHVFAFFPHEYAHSFTAWILGWKSNPLALNYGDYSISNLLAQFKIDENVDYGPIFSSEHGWQAGIIALAGLFIGNLIFTYPLSLFGFAVAKRRHSRTFGLFIYWLCVASVGNLIDYVPVRTFALDGDMHTVTKGFNCSPWLIIIILGIPFIIILMDFYFRFAPKALQWLFPDSTGKRVVTFILTALALFGFYGAAGWAEKDPISHGIFKFSLYMMMPLAILLGIFLSNRFSSKARLDGGVN